MNGEVPPRGFLRNYSLPKILITLNRSRTTGTLSVTAHGVSRKVFFQKGNAIFAASTYEEERLGEVLLKAGRINVRQYERAVVKMKATGRRLGAVLVELGYLDPRGLYWGVKYQVREIINSLFQLRDGRYEFEEGEVHPEVITLDLSTANIIYEGISRVEDRTRIKTEMPEEDTVFIISSDPRSLFQSVQLSGEDRMMLSLLDGERTMKQVIGESGLKSFEALRSLYILWSIGMITDQFGQDMAALTLEEILKPVEDSREEFIARVNGIYDALGSLSHHQLLAVDQYADIEQINRQYFRLAKEFHPDRYGDSLGPEVAEKITEIFDAITYAFESLKSSETDRQFTEGDLVLAEEMLKGARAEIRDGNYLRAAEFLEEAVKSDPENSGCWNYLSLALSRLHGRLPEAEKAMLRALKLKPENDEYIANLGLLYLRAGRTADAKAQFERALGLNPANDKARNGLSRIQPE